MAPDSAVLTSSSVQRVREALERAGCSSRIVELPGAARTAKAAAEFLGCNVAQIANSLVFRTQATNRPVLVMASGAHRVDTAKLARLLGEPVAKADADFVRRHTGFAIGGVPPAGHALRPVLVDATLGEHERLWAAAGHPHTVFALTYAELLRITDGTPAELAA